MNRCISKAALFGFLILEPTQALFCGAREYENLGQCNPCPSNTARLLDNAATASGMGARITECVCEVSTIIISNVHWGYRTLQNEVRLILDCCCFAVLAHNACAGGLLQLCRGHCLRGMPTGSTLRRPRLASPRAARVLAPGASVVACCWQQRALPAVLPVLRVRGDAAVGLRRGRAHFGRAPGRLSREGVSGKPQRDHPMLWPSNRHPLPR